MKVVALLLLLVSACTPKEPAPPAPPASPLDKRTPVPLLPMMAQHQKEQMREHLEAVQGIVTALAREDFDAVAQAAAAIAPSPGMAAQCRHMGAGAPGFTEAALGFHEVAAGIGAAAARRDRAGVAAALGETLQRCTGCHATWRQEVVDEATYRKLARGD